MAVSYNRLFKLLIDKNLKKTKFAAMAGISGSTLAKLSRNEYISLAILVKICQVLDCTFDDVIEIVPEDE
ncbi:DNA-binding transcriptional regulator, XRE family [Selenomonas sp. GACV-9]|uniref:helix-turn-helix domain-containing protein n=1 Tax=Selenomonas sp. GACV-9 TaxID=3158782 RepID=UPI0008E4B074|nr:DNA-binding transcriptional regulator, XRE family [Selenomonas ruminantium]